MKYKCLDLFKIKFNLKIFKLLIINILTNK